MLGKTTYPPLLRQLKSGAWVFGAGSAPVPDDWTWSIDLPSIYRGWVCQPHMPGDHAPLAEVMATFVEPRPARPEPVVGGDWREQWELMPRCLASEHNIKGSYKTVSMNGLGAIGLLLMQLMALMGVGEVFEASTLLPLFLQALHAVPDAVLNPA